MSIRDEVDKAGLLEASVIRISDPTSTIITATNARGGGGGGQNAAHANLTELRSSATTTSTAASDEETLLGRRYQSPYRSQRMILGLTQCDKICAPRSDRRLASSLRMDNVTEVKVLGDKLGNKERKQI